MPEASASGVAVTSCDALLRGKKGWVREKYAIVVGVSQFRNSAYNLRFAAKDASEPQVAAVNSTGILGPASVNGWTMSSVNRWNRLMSPHGVCHFPKSVASLSDAVAKAATSCCGFALDAM